MRRPLLVLLLLCASSTAACAVGDSLDDSSGSPSATPDAGHDAAKDADAASDVTTDTSTDAATDVAADTSTDAVADVVTDTAADAPADVATDTTADAPADVATDTTADAPADVATDTSTDAVADVAADTSTDAVADVAVDAPTTGAPETVVNAGGQPTDVALDDTHVYWADLTGGIYRAPLGGGAIDTVVGSVQSYAIALDASNVYYADYYTGVNLRRVPKTGGTTKTVATTSAATTAGIVQIVVSGSYVDFTASNLDAVLSYNLGGSLGGSAKIETSSIVQPMFLTVDGSDLYTSTWGGSQFVLPSAGVADGRVRWVSLNTSSKSDYTTARTRPSGLTVSGGALYYAVTDEGVIEKRPVPTGTVSTFQSGLTSPFRLTSDATYVYWTSYGTSGSSYADGSVHRAPIAGGAEQTIATSQDFASGIALSPTHVYWVTQNGYVMRAAR